MEARPSDKEFSRDIKNIELNEDKDLLSDDSEYSRTKKPQSEESKKPASLEDKKGRN